MSQDLAIWLIAAATIAAIYRFGRRGGRRPPDLSAGATDRLPGPVAAERICRQIEEIETELKLLAAARRELPTPEKLRAKWEKACVVAELGRSPIEATKVKGLSETVLRALRDAGFRTIGSLDTIRQAYVEGVGPEREDRLFKAYSAWREAAEAHVRRLEDKELDLRVKGAFSDEQVDMLSAQAELDRKREALEVRRAALRQRAADAQLDVRTAHRPRIAKAVEPAAVSRVCPRCGGPLVRRRGRRGPFLGCSRYPSCRYSRDVD